MQEHKQFESEDFTMEGKPVRISVQDFSVRREEPPRTVRANFSLALGDEGVLFAFNFFVRKTLLNRFKYWLFCQVFPFKITRWDK